MLVIIGVMGLIMAALSDSNSRQEPGNADASVYRGRVLALGGLESNGRVRAAPGRSGFGLTRFLASRGLDRLERADLDSVCRMPRWSPIVTILEANTANG